MKKVTINSIQVFQELTIIPTQQEEIKGGIIGIEDVVVQ